MKTTKTVKSPFIHYKGKPLVRCGTVIYYGDVSDKRIVRMESMETTQNKDLSISSNVAVEMIETNPQVSDTRKIIKSSKKSGLYSALDIASIWLERAQSEKS